jgi:hypothetical protein
MNRFLLSLTFTFVLFSCKTKKAKPEVLAADIFPVNDYLKGQVARMDTSLASYIKIETTDGRSDTTPIKNSEVKLYANDFLTLPDIASKELKDDYEVTHLYDEELDAFAFTFTTKEPHPVKSEHVILDPQQNAEGKNDIKSIFVDLWQNTGGSSIRKNMLWEAGKSFQITTTTDAPGAAEKIKKLTIIWNGFDSQTK